MTNDKKKIKIADGLIIYPPSKIKNKNLRSLILRFHGIFFFFLFFLFISVVFFIPCCGLESVTLARCEQVFLRRRSIKTPPPLFYFSPAASGVSATCVGLIRPQLFRAAGPLGCSPAWRFNTVKMPYRRLTGRLFFLPTSKTINVMRFLSFVCVFAGFCFLFYLELIVLLGATAVLLLPLPARLSASTSAQMFPMRNTEPDRI